jgi:hypothetical protein
MYNPLEPMTVSGSVAARGTLKFITSKKGQGIRITEMGCSIQKMNHYIHYDENMYIYSVEESDQ